VWALSGGQVPLALGVLQILCLDLLTDQLPALALSAEPASTTLSNRAPGRVRLLDRALLLRAFAVFGPIEALVSLSAFVAVLLEFGWVPGSGAPASEVLATASGSAFAAVVIGQSATALACRSSRLPALRVRISTNPALLGALFASWAIVALLLGVPPLARLLGHSVPSTLGIAIAACAFPAVLLGDWGLKRWRTGARAQFA
jgi:magnesium-transporting ATPase (P-type)